MLKILFLGTPDFSATVFNRLVESYPVAAVITGTDKPSGRKMELKPCPLKLAAQAKGVPVLQFDKVSREGIEAVRALAPELIITAAFGQILSDEFLSIPKYGVINVHASLLPKYRGSSPIQAAILAGDEVTGITVMRTVKEVDAGDVLLKKETAIEDNDNAGSLFDKLAVLGGECIVEAVGLINSGKAVYTPQNADEVTHCAKIGKAEGRIDWHKPTAELDRFVRAMYPWPSAYSYLNGKLFKVFDVTPEGCILDAEPGAIFNLDGKLIVRCGDGFMRVNLLQLEGGALCNDTAFLNGHLIADGTVLQ